MYAKALLVVALAAFSSAEGLNRRQFDPANIPSSIQNVLATAIPPASLPALVDPSGAASIASAFAAGQTPNWFGALPQSVKDFLSSEVAAGASAVNSVSSVVASATSSLNSVLSSATTTAGSSKAASATTTAASSASAASTSNPAARPTGALMAAGAGIVGVVAVAVGL